MLWIHPSDFTVRIAAAVPDINIIMFPTKRTTRRRIQRVSWLSVSYHSAQGYNRKQGEPLSVLVNNSGVVWNLVRFLTFLLIPFLSFNKLLKRLYIHCKRTSNMACLHCLQSHYIHERKHCGSDVQVGDKGIWQQTSPELHVPLLWLSEGSAKPGPHLQKPETEDMFQQLFTRVFTTDNFPSCPSQRSL